MARPNLKSVLRRPPPNASSLIAPATNAFGLSRNTRPASMNSSTSLLNSDGWTEHGPENKKLSCMFPPRALCPGTVRHKQGSSIISEAHQLIGGSYPLPILFPHSLPPYGREDSDQRIEHCPVV